MENYLKPLINTFSMELMAARENPQQLTVFEVTHTDNTVSLIHAGALDITIMTI